MAIYLEWKCAAGTNPNPYGSRLRELECGLEHPYSVLLALEVKDRNRSLFNGTPNRKPLEASVNVTVTGGPHIHGHVKFGPIRNTSIGNLLGE
jgi:hypothetical protein